MDFASVTRQSVAALATIGFLLVASPAGVMADFIAQWTFEISAPTAADSATIGGIAPESGAGTASGVHASAATDWSSPVGNGSNQAFSSNNWAVGDYYQFAVSTTGFFDISISWDQTRSATGPNTFDLQYQVNGGPFVTALTNYSVMEISWSSGAAQAGSHFSHDLTSVPAVDGVASLVFRLLAKTAGSSAAGTNRVDNFFVEATAVPEPAAVLFGCLVCCAFGSVIACRRLMGKPATAKPTTT